MPWSDCLKIWMIIRHWWSNKMHHIRFYNALDHPEEPLPKLEVVLNNPWNSLNFFLWWQCLWIELIELNSNYPKIEPLYCTYVHWFARFSFVCISCKHFVKTKEGTNCATVVVEYTCTHTHTLTLYMSARIIHKFLLQNQQQQQQTTCEKRICGKTWAATFEKEIFIENFFRFAQIETDKQMIHIHMYHFSIERIKLRKKTIFKHTSKWFLKKKF